MKKRKDRKSRTKNNNKTTSLSSKYNLNFKEILQKWWSEKHPILLFTLVFAACMLAFYALITRPFFEESIHPSIIHANASIASFFLNLLGQNTTNIGSKITSTLFAMNVKQGCDALEPIALFGSAVAAYPSSLGKKAMGIVAGCFLLFVVNIIRIISLFLVGIYAESFFDVMHVEVWQFLFILLAIALCFYWIRWTVTKVSNNELLNRLVTL